MSGGHFDYQQYRIGQIADDIQLLIDNNDSKETDQWGDRIGCGFSPEIIKRFEDAVVHLRKAQIYAQRIDWLVSGDDGENSFMVRLDEELKTLDTREGK